MARCINSRRPGEGLRSFARLLTRIANLKQKDKADLPVGSRQHIHLRPIYDICKSTIEVIVGRIDVKGTGVFSVRYLAKHELNRK